MLSRWLCLPLVVSCLLARPADATSCDGGHTLDSLTGDGSVAVLEDGSVWSIEAGDQPDVATWSESTSIAVCDGFLVNEDDHETAEAQEIKGPQPLPRRPVSDLSQYHMDPNGPVIAAPQPGGR